MSAYPLLVSVALASCIGVEFVHAETGKRKAPSMQTGEMFCNPQGCRPVRKGCHLERVGQFNEEVCNNLPVSLHAK